MSPASRPTSFVFGEPIRFDFAVENLTARELRVQFPDAQTTTISSLNNGTTRIRWSGPMASHSRR